MGNAPHAHGRTDAAAGAAMTQPATFLQKYPQASRSRLALAPLHFRRNVAHIGTCPTMTGSIHVDREALAGNARQFPQFGFNGQQAVAPTPWFASSMNDMKVRSNKVSNVLVNVQSTGRVKSPEALHVFSMIAAATSAVYTPLHEEDIRWPLNKRDASETMSPKFLASIHLRKLAGAP